MKKFIIPGIVLIGLILGVYAVLSTNSGPGPYDGFAQCLTESGVVMYGAYWCPHCNSQKVMFGPSFKFITYVECDPNGIGAQPELCRQAGITGYPTWIINGTQYRGEQTIEMLASLTGCEI